MSFIFYKGSSHISLCVVILFWVCERELQETHWGHIPLPLTTVREYCCSLINHSTTYIPRTIACPRSSLVYFPRVLTLQYRCDEFVDTKVFDRGLASSHMILSVGSTLTPVSRVIRFWKAVPDKFAVSLSIQRSLKLNTDRILATVWRGNNALVDGYGSNH